MEIGKILLKCSPYRAMQKACIERYQKYLDTGEYPEGVFNKTWDMLEWLDYQKELNLTKDK